MVSVCTVPARGGRSCEHFGGYKTINRIPLPLYQHDGLDPCILVLWTKVALALEGLNFNVKAFIWVRFGE